MRILQPAAVAVTILNLLSLPTFAQSSPVFQSSVKLYADIVEKAVKETTYTSQNSPSRPIGKTYDDSKNSFVEEPVVFPLTALNARVAEEAKKASNTNPQKYYVLVLPVNLGRRKEKECVVGALLNWTVPGSSDTNKHPANYHIESIYPTHQYLSEQFEHSNQLTATVSPQFAGFGAGSLAWQGLWKTSYGFDVPRVIGTLDAAADTVLWTFLRQGKQLIDPGTVTLFTTFSTTDDLTAPGAPQLKLGWALIYPEHKKASAAGLKDGVQVVGDSSAKTYIELHQAELPSGSLALLKALVAPTDTKTSVELKVAGESAIHVLDK